MTRDTKKHGDSEAPVHLEDELIHIQRHKATRARFELYMHNRDFRARFHDNPLIVPSEDENPPRPLKKKMLFHSLAYGEFLQALCAYCDASTKRRRGDNLQHFCDQLDQKKLEIHRALGESESPWDDVFRKLTKIVKTRIYEEFQS